MSCISVGENAGYELQVQSPNSNGSFCPGEIELTCTGRSVASVLNWFINESSIAEYVFTQSDHFPLNVIDSSVNITIVNATGLITIEYIDSTLSGKFSYLKGVSIRCGRGSMLSNNIIVEGYGEFISWK